MRVRYTWTEREWREAVALSQRKANRRPVLPGLTWALILLPLIGGIGDLIALVRRNGRVSFSGSILPLLLILLTVVAALLLGVLQLRRRRRRQSTDPMPAGEWEAVLQEGGWRFCKDGSPSMTMRPWDDMLAVRQGDLVLVLMCRDGFHAIPNVSLTPEQGGHIHRLVMRKLRPVL